MFCLSDHFMRARRRRTDQRRAGIKPHNPNGLFPPGSVDDLRCHGSSLGRFFETRRFHAARVQQNMGLALVAEDEAVAFVAVSIASDAFRSGTIGGATGPN